MVRQVRSSVFETNSSSTHSITIGNGPKVFPGVRDPLVVETGEFGWEIEKYTSFIDKAIYAFTYAIYCFDSLKSTYELELLNEVLEDYLQITILYMDDLGDTYLLDEILDGDGQFYYGYIDHQSRDDVSEIFESKEVLENFLFCEDSYFETDNDNH